MTAQRKKIAMVIAELGMPGGAEKVAADLAVEFHRRRHEVTIIKFDRPYPGEQLHKVPCRIIDIDVPERRGGMLTQLFILLQRTRRFRRIFRHEQFDHIFSFLEAANLPTVLATRNATLSMHLDPNVLTRKELLAMHWFYPRARKVITVSRAMQEALQSKTGLQNICCIYNPIDTRLVQEQAKHPIPPALTDTPFIVAVGRLETQKRFDRLLDAFSATRAHQHCRLLIIGEGKQRKSLEQQIATLNLQNRVELCGFDDNPYRYMAKAEFLVMSSDYEGYPLVLIEALVLGCPVVSTDCPTGPREIIQQGVNGLLVETDNTAALADSIDQLFFDTELRTTLRRNAVLSVQNNDIAVVAEQWLATADSGQKTCTLNTA